ncbi:MAG: ABC transporter permease [Ktedonobacteraceae bacterium]|nr:ABC transporter permease [Ktedonobacteraceae bacterium]MBO0796399.1 ABC transporter permease [Ktedonobacteraceae bacterium]
MQTQQKLHPVEASQAVLLPGQPIHERLLGGLAYVWRALTSNRKVALGSAILGFFILVAIFGPMLPLQDPTRLSDLNHAAPSAQHWLGTTTTGQDLFSQLVHGTRATVFWSLLTGVFVMILSVVIGLVGGYFGGIIDEILSLVTNVFLVLPALPLMIVLAAYFPRGPLTVSLVITFTSWAWGARVLRAQTLSLRAREFIAASRSTGEQTWRIIFFEIFPNEISIVAAGFVTTTINVVLSWTALEFLGLGDSSTVSWGSMLYWAQQASALFSGLWWWFIPPGLCIALLGLGLALINFGIDEVADPRLRSERESKKSTEKKDQEVLAA